MQRFIQKWFMAGLACWLMLAGARVTWAQTPFITSDFGTVGTTPINLTSYTSAVGGAYAKMGYLTNDFATTATTPSRIRNFESGAVHYYNATAAPGQVYSVYAKITNVSAINTYNVGISGRIVNPTAGTQSSVCLDFDSGNAVRFYWKDAGTLGGPGGSLQSTSISPTAGQFVYLRLDFTATTAQAFTIVSSTDTVLTSVPALGGWTSTGAAATIPTNLQATTTYVGPLAYGLPTDTTGPQMNGLEATTPSNAPVYASSAVPSAGSTLAATFTGGTAPLTFAGASSAANNGGFTVMVGGSPVTVSSVSASGSVVTLNLASTVYTGQAVTVAYTSGGNGTLRDSAGTPNSVATFVAQTTTNNSTQVANATGYSQTGSPVSGSTVAQASPLTITYALTGGSALSSSLVITPASAGVAGTFASGTLTYSGGTVTIPNGTTTGTITFTPSATGALTLSASHTGGGFAGGDPSSMTYTVSGGAVQIAVNNTLWYFSPYNWYSTGGTFQTANNIFSTATYAQAVNPGAYNQFIAASTGNISLKVDTSALSGAGVAAGAYPKIKWSVDAGAWQTYQFASGDTTKVLFSGTSGTHGVVIYFMASEGGFTDRWTTPVSSLKITGLTLDNGASLASIAGTYLAPLAKNAIWFGDSIEEGAWTLATAFQTYNAANYVTYADAQLSWTGGVSLALGANEGRCAFGGQSWLTPLANANIPVLANAWNYYYSTNSRLSAGKLFPIPDYIFINMGANDGAGNWQATAQSTITALRAAVNTTTPIFLMVPFGRQGASYPPAVKTALGDNYLYILDAGQTAYAYLQGYSGGNANKYSADGLHPNGAGNAAIYTPIVAQSATAATGTTTTVTKTIKPSRQLPRNSRN